MWVTFKGKENMGGTIINGKEEKAALLEDLLKATKENIETTTEQNRKMRFYTRWVFIMTAIITLCTLLQAFLAYKIYSISG